MLDFDRNRRSLPIGGGYRIRLIARPGRRYDARACDELTGAMRAVADRCVPTGRLRYGVLSGDRERLSAALIALALDPRGDVVGFSAMTMLDMPIGRARLRVVHAGLCLVDPAERRAGLCGLLTAFAAVAAVALNGLRPVWFTNVTQVPAAAGVFAEAAQDVWPAPGRAGPPPTTHRRIAKTLLGRHRAAFGVGEEARFDADRFVIEDAYTGGSDDLKKRLADCSDHRDGRYASWCADMLDYDRGDDLVQVGRLSGLHCLGLALRCLRGLARRRWRAGRRLVASPAVGALR